MEGGRLRTRVTKSKLHGQVLESLFSQGLSLVVSDCLSGPIAVMLTGMKAYFELERNV